MLKFRIGFPFGENSCWVLQVRVASGVETEFPYRVHIVDRGVDCRDPVCRHLKNLLMPLFLRKGYFPGDIREGKRPIKASGETAH